MPLSAQPLLEEADFQRALVDAKAGNATALSACISTSLAYLHRVVRARFPQKRKSDSDLDVVQETVLRAIRGLHGFRGSTKGEFVAWVRTIFLNLFANYRLQRRRRPRPLSPMFEVLDPHVSTSESVESDELHVVNDALENLADPYRRILLLRGEKGMTWEAIGRKTNRSADAARMLHARALRKLAAAVRSQKREREREREREAHRWKRATRRPANSVTGKLERIWRRQRSTLSLANRLGDSKCRP